MTKTIPNQRFAAVLLLVPMLLVAFSCKTDPDNSYEQEMEQLAEYIQTNNITVAPTASGLYYIELSAGTGQAAQPGESVTVQYTGRMLDGTVFDSGTISFVLGTGRVIKGWDEGIALMKHGGTARLIVPSSLAYGDSGAGSIPAYTTLVFDVTLL